MWCVRVPSGAFVARRNGRIFITGNSGFPKSLDVSKAIDKAAGAERKVVGTVYHNRESWRGKEERTDIPSPHCPITIPATPDAERWQGWGTALKPANEIVCMARKPLTDDVEQCTIVANLSRMEAQLWSLLPVRTAVESFGLSQSEYAEACASAQWSADERSSTLAGLSGQMDMSQLETAISMSLSIVKSWKNLLADLLILMNTSIIETASSLTIDLRTLNYYLSDFTPQCIILGVMQADGQPQLASLVASLFSAVSMKLGYILERSVAVSATSGALISCLDGAGRGLILDSNPICMARKPLSEATVAANVLRWGTGAINVDECRIPHAGIADLVESEGKNQHTRYKNPGSNRDSYSGDFPPRKNYNGSNGRWPANVLLDEEAAAMLDEQTGVTSTTGNRSERSKEALVQDTGWLMDNHKSSEYPGDNGRPSRFFYTAKADSQERVVGLHAKGGRNNHPTVKPLSLMKYLCLLVTPPNGIVIDPFLGSGTTGMACQELGYNFIGIELDSAYLDLARARIMGSQVALPFYEDQASDS